MFFISKSWADDMLNELLVESKTIEDTINIGYSVSDSGETDVISKPEDFVLLVASSLYNAAVTSGSDIFVTSASGKVFICKDMIIADGDKINIEYTCPKHSGIRIPAEMLKDVREQADKYGSYTSEGPIPGFGSADYFTAAIPVYNGSTVRCYIFAVRSVTEGYLPYITQYIRMTIVSGMIAVVLVFILSTITTYRIVKPLKVMNQAAARFSVGDFSRRIEIRSNYGELNDLADAYNSMAENLNVLEQSRSSFVANISHELKTPMTTISGFVDGILDGTIPIEDREHYLRIISDEVKRLSRLVIAMLNMSKIEAGKLKLNPTEINLSQVVINTFIGFEPVITKKDINIIGLDNIENVVVRGDATLLYQVLYNLTDNAIKFTPQSGTISVRLYNEKKNCVFSIKNTGKGIPSDEIGLIFDRFYKLDKSRGLDAQSFGLGLYIVKSVIELHGGSIAASSEEDSFTEFIVTLPI